MSASDLIGVLISLPPDWWAAAITTLRALVSAGRLGWLWFLEQR